MNISRYIVFLTLKYWSILVSALKIHYWFGYSHKQIQRGTTALEVNDMNLFFF